MDLCGFPKTEFYIRQALWVKDRPVLTLVPHWNWPGREGKPVRVMVLANGETVELFLNGKSLGEKPVDPFEMVSWEIPYVPGKLEAIGKSKGSHVSNFTVETTGEPVSLRLTPDRKSLAGDGCDAIPVTVEALDREGRPVTTANLMVEFEISGPGAIIGLGSEIPCHEPEKGNRRSLFNGLAQVIVQSRRDGSGTLVLRANADGLKSAESIIRVNAQARC
jgi:beta-galactosidase